MTSPPVERRDEELRCDAGASPRPSTAEASAASDTRNLIYRLRNDGSSWAQPLFNMAAHEIERLRALADERFSELKRAQSIIDGLKAYRESLLTCPLILASPGRARIRELSDPPRDDHDRAVLMLLDDTERLIAAIEAKVSP